MKRWLPWFALPVLACLWILANRSSAPALLTDTDTSVLLRALNERHNPVSWFWTDWPLQNHFYRPVSTLSFELDNALHPGDAAGFGLTNALIAVVCVMLLFWLVRELTEKPWMAAVSSALFGLWHVSPTAVSFLDPVCWVLAAIALPPLLRGFKKNFASVALATLTLAFVSTVWQPVAEFNTRIVSWLPGRTASTMTVFALVAMASYCRFERLSSGRSEPAAPTATDLPATKGTEVVVSTRSTKAWVWFCFAVLSLVLALGCYEQAVMVPATLVACAVLFRVSNRRPHWWCHAVFWAVLLGYLVVRARFVPSGPSAYQEQQFRNGPGVLIAITDYAFPSWSWGTSLLLMLGTGAVLLLTAGPWVTATLLAGNFASWVSVWKDTGRWQVIAWFAMSLLAFLPMSWLQPFGHYHYWPSALRAVYAVSLATVAVRAWVNAVGRPSLQAPLRLRPAPGSLPRQ